MARRPVNAGRRPDIEKMLTDKGFSWEYRHAVPVADFDVQKSQRNQARLGNPLDQQIVDRYRAALSNGDLFPAVLAAPQRRGGLVIADGNHRLEAHAQSNRPVDTYVITNATPQALTMLTFEANTKHGLPTSEAERIHHALWLVDNGMSSEEAAKRLGLKTTALRNAGNLNAAGRRSDDAGILRTEWETLPPNTMLRLHGVSTDEGFAALAKLTIAAKLSATELGPHVTEMNALRSSRKQVEYVRALEDVYSDRVQTGGLSAGTKGPGRRSRTPRQQLGVVLGQIAVLSSPEAITEFFTDDERLEYAERLDGAIEALTAVRKALV